MGNRYKPSKKKDSDSMHHGLGLRPGLSARFKTPNNTGSLVGIIADSPEGTAFAFELSGRIMYFPISGDGVSIDDVSPNHVRISAKVMPLSQTYAGRLKNEVRKLLQNSN